VAAGEGTQPGNGEVMSSGSLATYAAKRTGMVIVTTFVVSSLTFVLIHSLAGNPFTCMTNPASCRSETHLFGLDRPLIDQYGTFMWHLLHFNLGYSYVNQSVQITHLLLTEARASLTLGACALVVTVVVGLAVGIATAVRQNTWLDYSLSSFVILGYSIPNFVLATFAIVLTTAWFPNWSGIIGWGAPSQVILPAICLGLPFSAVVARMTRASLLEVLGEDYIRTAWAKGLPQRKIILRHALKNGLIPVVTIGGPLVTSIVTGSVVIENIFGIPGLGKEFVQSLLTRDYNLVVGLYTFYAIAIGLANLAVDLAYPFIDPKVRYK
jgi:ABC-type dipeptide/oligopeptide/nickel transport system permease component